jgi:hypothetical protein
MELTDMTIATTVSALTLQSFFILIICFPFLISASGLLSAFLTSLRQKKYAATTI